MAALRRAIISNLHQTLKSIRNANPTHTATLTIRSETLIRYRLGSVSLFSSESLPSDIDLSNEESKRRIFNRLLYRSRQRGFLELDLVLGKWVEEHINYMDESRIKALVDVLDLENPDLWKWLTCQEQPPEAVNRNPVFCAVRDKVMGNFKNHASPDTRATPGKQWVRGWDDCKKAKDGPIFGNQ